MIVIDDCCFALLHEPAGCGGGTADAYRLPILDEREVYLVATLDVVRVGVGLETFVIQYLAVAAFLAAHEEDEVVGLGEAAYVFETV